MFFRPEYQKFGAKLRLRVNDKRGMFKFYIVWVSYLSRNVRHKAIYVSFGDAVFGIGRTNVDCNNFESSFETHNSKRLGVY